VVRTGGRRKRACLTARHLAAGLPVLLRSWSNTLVSVRLVAQRNKGSRTPGIDGAVALDGPARMRLARKVHRTIRTWRPQPVRRVHIPKAGKKGKQRPLGIPVLTDRAHQARVKQALEPEWEARFEGRSYGFRPGRCCQDAAGALYVTLKGNSKRAWVLDADLASAFDKISHAFLLEQLGGFPAREMIAGWLKAGVFEAGKGFAPTEEGTPQGGVISPVMLNVALHGLEEAAGVRYSTGLRPNDVLKNSPVATRYADDFTVCCHSRRQAEEAREKLTGWLAERGLSLNEDKTRIVHLTEGFDFLGWNFRRYPGGKLLIKPSKAAVRKHRQRLADEMRNLRGSNAQAVIARLGPVIRGWTAYHRCMVSSEVFDSLTAYMWRLTYKWARHSHPNKPAGWVTGKYYGKFNPSRDDRWVFGDRETGTYLPKHDWTSIRRHVMVKGRSSPDDPDLAGYWEYRRKGHRLPLSPGTSTLLARQDMRCPHCADLLLDVRHLPSSPEEWENWHLSVTRQLPPAPGDTAGPRPPAAHSGTGHILVHASCHRSTQAAHRRSTERQLQPAAPLGPA
jgi:RNA-directed DNA polymerase